MEFPLIEMIQLTQSQPEVQEWAWIEMIPQLQQETKEHGIHLRGHLKFLGEYQSSSSIINESWTYQMPIEITLPVDRVEPSNELNISVTDLAMEKINGHSWRMVGKLFLNGMIEEKKVDAAGTLEAQEVVASEVVASEVVASEVVASEVQVSAEKQVIIHEDLIVTEVTPVIFEEKAVVIAEKEVTIEQPSQRATHWSNWLTKSKLSSESTYTLRMIIVRESESLTDWAKRFDVSPRAILQHNRLENDQLQVGQFIWIP